MSYATAEAVALRIAIVLKRSGQPRLRITDKGYRLLSGRQVVRTALLDAVTNWLYDLGIAFIRLERGGYVVIKISSLDGTKMTSISKLFPLRERENMTVSEMYEVLDVPEFIEEDEE